MQHRMRNISVTAFAVILLTTGLGMVPGQSPTAPPELPHAAARMYAIVKKVRPGELRWQEIPWLVDLQDGLRLAKEENRPLLLWVSGDDPLEKC